MDELLQLVAAINTRLARIEAALGQPSPDTYSVAEVAARRKRSIRFIYNLIDQGVIRTTGPKPYRIAAVELAKVP